MRWKKVSGLSLRKHSDDQSRYQQQRAARGNMFQMDNGHSQKKGNWSDMWVWDDLQGFVEGCEGAGSRSAFVLSLLQSAQLDS